VLFGLLIVCEKRHMEDIVYLPMGWEFDLICNWGYYGDYPKGSILPWW
jgi:hypothetical protein